MLWTQKYAPQTPAEVVGQGGVQAVSDFIQRYPGRKKAVLLYGPSGCGKTTSIYALANERGDELLEINASDTRNAASLNALLGSALKQRSLFGKNKIILVDELDGLSGMEDRGGVDALIKLLEHSFFPVVLITSDPYERKLSSLRSKCELIEFMPLSPTVLAQLLSRIAAMEGINAPAAVVKALARRSGGDARAAIIDLQTLTEKSLILKADDLSSLGERRQNESMMKALMKILKTTDSSVAVAALDAVDEDLDDVMLWIDENLPKEYKKPQDLVRAYNAVAKADIFRSWIRRWQYWRLLAYVHIMLTSGVALAKEEKYSQFSPYGPPQRLLKIWRLNMKNAKKKSIAEKIAQATHCGTRKAMKQMPYFQKMKEIGLELSDEEKDWFRKSR